MGVVELDKTDTGTVKHPSSYYFGESNNSDFYTNIAKGPWDEESNDLGTEFTNIEAPYIYYNAEQDYYYLFVNWGTCCSGIDSTYNIRIGRSRNVEGPYEDQDGNRMLDAGGSSFMSDRPSG